MENTDKNTQVPQSLKTAVMPSYIYLVTNETDRTVERCYYNSADAIKELKKLDKENLRKVFMVIEHPIN